MKFKCMWVAFALMFFVTSFAETANAGNGKTTVKIIETTDVHGNFYGYDFLNSKELKGGLPRVSTYVKLLRNSMGNDDVALLDAGDVLQGQPCVYYTNFIDTLSEHLSSRMMNYMGYDAVAFGNHDIEAGHHVYDRWIKDFRHPMLGANIVSEKDGSQYVKPYIILYKGGLKIAVLGLITPAIPMWLPHDLWSGLRFEDIVPAARQWAEYIERKEKPDLLIGLFHTGLKESGMNGYNENAAEEIATTVPGFDVIFYGHDHQPHCQKVKNAVTGKSVWLLNAGPSANNVAEADITISKTKNCGKTISVNGSLVPMDKYEPDKSFLQKFQSTFDKVESYVTEKIGSLDHSINTFDYFFGVSQIADLLHTVQFEHTKADISLITPLTYNEVIKAGDIHVSDVFKLYRYENRIDVFLLSGKEICGALERAYDMWTNTMKSPSDHALKILETDGKRPRLAEATFLFMSAAGIRYTVDLTKPDGQKVCIKSMADGRIFDKEKTYRVAVNSYIGSGGGGLLTEGAGISMKELPERITWTSDKDLRFYIIEYFRNHAGAVDIKPVADWQFVPLDWTEKALERDRLLLSGK